jgi:thiol-disulfide isomerase/thioredoxin
MIRICTIYTAILALLVGVAANTAVASEKVGELAPEFTAQTRDGQTISLKDYRGKVVVLDFWASWCGPCRDEMPFLMSLSARNKEKAFQLITVNIDDKSENMEKFLSKIWSEAGVFVVDRKKEIPKLYNLETMPTTVFIDREGVIRYWHDGFTASDEEQYESELSRLLSRK